MSEHVVGQYNSILACFHLFIHVVKGCSTCIIELNDSEYLK